MGCDIHAFVEVKQNGQWKYYDWRKEFQIGKYEEDGSPEYDYSKMFDSPFYIGRNYDLFAILATARFEKRFHRQPESILVNPKEEERFKDCPFNVKSDSMIAEGYFGLL